MSSMILSFCGKTTTLPIEPNTTLLDILRRSGVPVTAPCGGNGTCGKCRVTIQDSNGFRSALACQTIPTEDCHVWLEAAQGGTICTDGLSLPVYADGTHTGLGAAADLGTTTIAIKLFDLSTGQLLGSVSDWNCQAPYGGDVITRCQYCMEHPDGLTTLQQLLWEQLLGLLQTLCRTQGCPIENVTELVLVGNTVMQHLAAGLSPVSIAVAPFRPLSLFQSQEPIVQHSLPIQYAPCVAGYVGGDITAGLLACGLGQSPERSLFLDIGTNGEMALGGADGFLCCAVASGPAFEGAGISCGMASTEGAISHVRWQDGAPVLEVIGSGKPKGLCGSGLLDLLAMLLELGIVDETGYLLPPEEADEDFGPWLEEDEDGNGRFFLTPDHTIFFSAADVRQLQLAKAAVAAGISVLMEQANITFDQLDHLYLAGGFGTHMDAASAIAIGMLPRAMQERIVCVSNSALSGASLALLQEEKRQELYQIQQHCTYFELSGNAAFNRLFPEHMTFEEEELPWNCTSL